MNDNELSNFPEVDSISNYSMKHLKHLDISSNNFLEIDKKLSIFNKLEKFITSNNKISKITESISNLTKLNYFDLNLNELESLPNEFGSCKQLTYLDLSYNKFTDIPNALVGNIKLTTLKMGNNSLQQDINGKVFGFLADLEVLEMQNNMISNLPSLFYFLKKISYLDISYNKIKAFHESISSLKGLKFACLHHNEITSMPSTISDLTKLTVLELNHNLLTDLPSSISNLININRITIHNNNFLKSPNLLQLLPKLISYTLSWNMNIQSNLKDYEKLSKTYNSKKEYIPIDVLKFKLLKAFNQMEIVIKPPVKVPLFQNEITSITDDKNDIIFDETDGSGNNNTKKSLAKSKKKKSRISQSEKETVLIEKTFHWIKQLDEYLIKYIDKNKDITLSNILATVSIKDISSEILVANKTNQAMANSKIQLLTILKNIDTNRKLSFNINDYLLQNINLPDNEILSSLDLGYSLQDLIETYQKLASETVSLIVIDELKYLAENIDKSESVLSNDGSKIIDIKRESFWNPKFVWICNFINESSIFELILIGNIFEDIDDIKQTITKFSVKNNISKCKCVFQSILYDCDFIRDKAVDNSKLGFSISFGSKGLSENERLYSLEFSALKMNKDFNVEGILKGNNEFNGPIELIRYDKLPIELEGKYSILSFPYLSPLKRDKSNQLLDLAMGSFILVNQSVVDKKDLIDFNELPYIFHSIPIAREDNDELIESLFSCYINMSKLLIKRSECIRDAIRIVEIRGKIKVSSLDIAQRRGDDVVDILGSAYDSLAEEAAISVSNKLKESNVLKKSDTVASLAKSFLMLGLGDNEEVSHDVVSTDDESKKDGKKKNKKQKKSKDGKPGKDENEPPVEIKPKELTIADIISKIDKGIPLIDPIPYSTAKSTIDYLNRMRFVSLIWAYKLSTCAENILYSNGYNIRSRHYRLKDLNPISIKEWIRDGICKFHYNQAILYKYLQIYDKAEYEYKTYFKVCSNKIPNDLKIELIKVNTAQGKYIHANNLIREMIYDFFPNNLKSDPPKELEIIKKSKILGNDYLIVYLIVFYM